jgi:hypothetical protein
VETQTAVPEANQHVMAIMNSTGDTKIVWDMSKKKEVKHAEDTFNKLKKEGYLAYSVKKNGDMGKVLHTFDPKIEKMILSPRIVGG